MKTVELELPTTSVGPGCRATLLVRPGSVAISPYGLLVDDEASQHFLVTDVRCGRDSQLVSRGAVPASVFSNRAVREELYLGFVPADPDPGEAYDTLQVSTDPRLEHAGFTLGVFNTSDVERTFSGRILGWIEEGRGTAWRWTCPDKFRTVVGLGYTEIPGRQAAHVNVMPQFAFLPDRLVIPSSTGSRFDVLGVRTVAHDSNDFLGCAAGQVRGDAYSERLSEGHSLSGLTSAGPGRFLCASILNTGEEPASFSGAFLGTAWAM